jgi:outer membrane protein assembly factor BamD
VEQSRAPVDLKYKAFLLITARPSTVQASRVGEPSLTSPAPIMAPDVLKDTIADVNWAIKPDGKPAPAVAGTSNNIQPSGVLADNGETTPSSTGQEPAAAGSNGLQMNDVSGSADVNGSVVNNSDQTQPAQSTPTTAVPPVASPCVAPDGNAVQSPAGTANCPPGTAPSVGGHANPAVPPANSVGDAGHSAEWPSARKNNGGLPVVGPANNTPLPAAQKAAAAPAQMNDVNQSGQAVNTAADQNTAQVGKKNKKKKNPKPAFKGKEESSSTHKKKKGLRRLNPF